MMKDYLTGNWRNNALADYNRPAYEVRNNDMPQDGFGAVGGGLGGFRQAQQPLQQPQWAGIDQTQWRPQFSQPVANPYTQYATANPLSSYTQPMQYQNALSMYSRWG